MWYKSTKTSDVQYRHAFYGKIIYVFNLIWTFFWMCLTTYLRRKAFTLTHLSKARGVFSKTPYALGGPEPQTFARSFIKKKLNINIFFWPTNLLLYYKRECVCV